MEIVETTNEGLKRAYALTIPASEINARIDAEVKKVAPQVRMPGFRPGKVPANLVRKMHGEALHSEALNTVVRESVEGLIRDNKLRPALQPRVDFKEGYEQGKDAELAVEVEILPEIEAPELDDLKLERLTVPVTDAMLDESLQRFASSQKSYKDAAKTKKAAEGDQLIIDFVGSLDGEEFEGGKAEDAALVLGSGQFIPGFEEQLTGVKTGEEKTIKVTFPEDYPAENLKGKEADFAITVKQVKVETESVIDDEFAKNLGLESLDKLKELMKGQLEQETAGLTRTQMKRQLLDRLAKDHDFPVPPSMVEAEFEQIWNQLTAEAQREEDPEAALKEIENEREDYRRIAERRVRLGLLLSEIGQKNGVEISNQEMQMLVQQAAQQYRPEDRQRFLQYVQQDPMAQAQIRAPLYEDKVVDFLFDKAEVTEREVTREELEAAIEAEEDTDGTSESGKAKAKPAAKKAKPAADTKAETAEGESAERPAPAKKKPAAKKPAAAKAQDDKAEAEDAKAPAPAAKKPAARKAPAKKPAAAAEGDEPTKKLAPRKKAPAKTAAKPAAKAQSAEGDASE